MPDKDINKDRRAFEKWLEDTYGIVTAIRIGKLGFQTEEQLRNNQYYQYWVSIGKPGLIGGEADIAEQAATKAALPLSQTPEFLTPTTRNIMAGNERIPTGEEGDGAPEIVNIGGVTYQVTIDENGQKVWSPIDKSFLADPGGISEAQQAQLDLQYAQLRQGGKLAQQQFRSQQMDVQIAQQNRLQQQLVSGVQGRGGDRRQQAADWQQRRDTLLGVLDPNLDWIQKFQLEGQTNPFAPGEETLEDEIKQVEGELGAYDRAYQRIQKRLKDPDDPLTLGTALLDPALREGQRGTEFGGAQAQALQIIQGRKDLTEKLINLESEAAGVTPEQFQMLSGRNAPMQEVRAGVGNIPRAPREPRDREPPRPTTPATPDWLRTLYPQLGENISKITPIALSGQAFGRLDPSQRQQWQGFVNWAGGSAQDLLAQTQRRLPQPTRGTRAAPARQF